MTTKSGLFVGMGETDDEVVEALTDLAGVGVDIVTIGQYLRPTAQHLPVERYYDPSEYEAFREHGRRLGFTHVESGPLVRSSYHAEKQAGVPVRAEASDADLIPLREVPRG